MAYMAKHPDRYDEERCYNYAKRVIRHIRRRGQIRTYASGLENLPAEGGYVMFPNHQGKYDALGIIYTHEKPCTVVMDDAKSYMPITKQFLDVLHGKRLKLNDIKQSLVVINEIAKEVSEGRRYIIFPEGGYNHNRNKVNEFKAGSFKCAMKAKAPIVPVVLIDSWKAFEGFSIGPVKTQVHYLKPLYYEEYKNMTTVEVCDLVQSRIKNHMVETNYG